MQPTELDPKITVAEALAWAGDNQAELGRRLGIGRASVNEWLFYKREYLPALQAHRYVRIREGEHAAA